ncbi:MAG: UPF0272 protein [Acidimicrobiales bacterium]|nr:MAG: UPF0272 protein [Acidimicrobiales bacterium]
MSDQTDRAAREDGLPNSAGVGSRVRAWFDCQSGISGDMALGALVDAGADLAAVGEMCRGLPLEGWELESEQVTRCGLAATRVLVRHREEHVVRTAGNIMAMVRSARLPERVKARALAVFSALARAEGRLHRRPPEQVHFHEIGGMDAILDVVGTCAALELLGVDVLTSSEVAQGRGMVRTSHGLLPVPAPAVLELLRGVPLVGTDLDAELTTPTGAAIVGALSSSFGPLPPMVVKTIGHGAGSRDLADRPNVTRVVLGVEPAEEPDVTGTVEELVQVEANVDDATGEILADTLANLLASGALDAWVTPVVMKKGRPGHVVSALCRPADAGPVTTTLMRTTGSLGVRRVHVTRFAAERREVTVWVAGQPVRVKLTPLRPKVEHDDALAASIASGIPLREVISIAERLATDPGSGQGGGTDDQPGPGLTA